MASFNRHGSKNDLENTEQIMSAQEAASVELQPSNYSSPPSSSSCSSPPLTQDSEGRPYGGEGSRNAALPDDSSRVYVTDSVSDKRVLRSAAIGVAQLTTRSGMDRVMNMATCIICFEDTAVYKMFAVDGCLHQFCLPCMKQHVEVKLLNGMMAKCPHIGCTSEVNVDKCEAFLEPKLIEKIRQRMKEASIPVTAASFNGKDSVSSQAPLNSNGASLASASHSVEPETNSAVNRNHVSGESTSSHNSFPNLSPPSSFPTSTADMQEQGVVGDGDSDMFSINIEQGIPGSSLDIEVIEEDGFAFCINWFSILIGLFVNLFNALVAQIGIRLDEHKVGPIMTALSLAAYIITLFQFMLYAIHLVADFMTSRRSCGRDFWWLFSFALFSVILLVVFGIYIPHVSYISLCASAFSIFMGLCEFYLFISDLLVVKD